MRSRVFDAVIETIIDIQTASGRPTNNISGNTRPMSDLKGFDSLNAVEASFGFSASIGCEIADDIRLFVDSSTGEPRTIDEIVDTICSIVEQ